MKNTTFTRCCIALATGIFIMLSSCSTDDVITTEMSRDIDITKASKSHGKVIHQASIGGNDACESLGLAPGCDKSFSFVANMYEDGTIKGQWQDKYGDDLGGIHVAIDCMTVDGNTAQVGGFITKGTDASGNDISGQYAVTFVVDNGTSANDTPDQMSFSYSGFDPANGCNYSGFPLLDLTKGQVKVW